MAQLILLAVVLCLPVTAHAHPVAEVVLVQGSLEITRDGGLIKGERDLQLNLNDRLTTGPSSRALIRFNDATRLWLSEDTELEIEQFDVRSKNPQGQFKLLSGALRTVTGLITKKENASFEIDTVVATMGVRGTDFWGGFFEPGVLDVTLFEGTEVYIRNEQGRVSLTQRGQGTSVRPGKAPSEVSVWGDEKLSRAVKSTEFAP